MVHWPWVWLPVAGPVRISTVLAAVLMVAVIVWRRRDPMLAMVALLAWASAYEVAYQGTGALVHGWPLAPVVWMTAAIAGWVVLAQLIGLNPNRWLLLLFALVWMLWVAAGFESNVPSSLTAGGPKHFSVVAEAFNEVSKTMLALAYLLGALGSSMRTMSAVADAHHDAAHQHHVTQ